MLFLYTIFCLLFLIQRTFKHRDTFGMRMTLFFYFVFVQVIAVKVIALLWVLGFWFDFSDQACSSDLAESTSLGSECMDYIRIAGLIDISVKTVIDIYFAKVLLKHAQLSKSSDYFRITTVNS